MDPYIRIYCESDFDFQYKLDSAHVNMPFKFIFFTTDINRNFECTFDGETYVHCTKVDNDSIVFHIDGNTFGLGNLRIRKEYFIDSASFDDNICNSVDVEKTNIYIIEEGSNANSVVYEGSTLPNFDAVLIGERAEQALIEIDEKETELDDILGEAQLWEDRIENIEASYVSHEELDDTLNSYVTKTNLDNTLNSYVTKANLDNTLNSYVTKANLDNTLASYVTQESLSANAYLTQHQSLADYVTKNDLSEELTSYPTFNDISNMTYATQAYVQNKINEIPQPDLSAYVTKVELNNAGYISNIPDEYITDSELNSCGYATQTYVQNKINEIPTVDLTGYATESYVVNYVATYAPEPDLSNYVTKNYLSNAGYISSVPSEYITQEELSANSYLTQHQSLDNYVTKNDLNNASYATQTYVQNKINEIPTVDLTGYATESYVVNYVATYAPEPDLSNYITYSYADNNYPSYSYIENQYATYDYVDQAVEDLIIGQVDLHGYVTEVELYNASYATKSYVADYVAAYAPTPDLSAYVTKQELNNAGYLTSVPAEYITQAELSANAYLTQHQNLDNYVTKNDLNNASYATKSYVVDYVSEHGGGSTPDMSAYVTKTELNNASYATQSYVMDKVNEIEPITYTTTYETTYENISIWQGTYAMYQSLPDYTSYQLYLIQQE